MRRVYICRKGTVHYDFSCIYVHPPAYILLFFQPPIRYIKYVKGGWEKSIYIVFPWSHFPCIKYGKGGCEKSIYIVFPWPPITYVRYGRGGCEKSIYIYIGKEQYIMIFHAYMYSPLRD